MVRQRIYSKKRRQRYLPALNKRFQNFGIFEACRIWQLFEDVFQIPFRVQVVCFARFD